MGWFVDGVDLSTYAFNVQNRSASWSMPARRGENVVVPGRHGRRWNDRKPFDEGSLTLNMWAVGAEEDGSMPFDGDRRRKCLENIKKLTGVFGQSGRLLEVVRSESSQGTITNLIPNPSGEGPTVPVVIDQNLVRNPAFDGNYSLTTEETVARNYVRNPTAKDTYRMAAWAPVANDILVSSSVKHSGTTSWRVRAQTAGATTLGIRSLVQTPPAVWTCSVWVYVPATLTQTITGARVAFYDSEDPTVGQVAAATVVGGSIVKGQWNRFWATVETTETWNYVFFYLQFSPALGANAVLYFDDMLVTHGPRLWDYYDGDTPNAEPYGYRWMGVPHKSFSLKTGRRPNDWLAEPGANIVRDSTVKRSGFYSMRVMAQAWDDVDGGTTNTWAYTECPVLPGDVVSATAQVRWGSSSTPRPVGMTFHVLDSNGTLIDNQAGTVVTPTTGAWSEVKKENYTVPAGGVLVRLLVVGGQGGTAGVDDIFAGDEWLVDDVSLRKGTTAAYFYGSQPGDTRTQYGWAGTPNASISQKKQLQPYGWYGANALVGVFKDTSWAADGSASVLVTATNAATTYTETTGGSGPRGSYPVFPGTKVTAMVTVKALHAGRVRVGVRQYDADGVLIGYAVGGIQDADMALGEIREFRLDGVTLSSDTRGVRLLVFMGQTGGFVAPNWTGDAFAVDKALIALGSYSSAQIPLSNGTFEVNTTGWFVSSASCTITRDTTIFHGGVASMLMVPTVGQTVATTGTTFSTSPTVIPGQVYTAKAWLRTSLVWPNLTLDLQWLDAAGNVVSTITGPPLNLPEDVFVQCSASGQAPQGAAKLSIRVSARGNPTTALGVFIDDVTVEQAGLFWFDGDSDGSYWQGEEHKSASQYGGTALRCFAEVREAVDFTSMAGGTRAEFAVNMAIPGAFWEEVVPVTFTSGGFDVDTTFELDVLAGSTAPIEDAVITLTGPLQVVRLTDVVSGAFVRYAAWISATDTVVIDVGKFTVTKNGVSDVKNLTHGGSAVWLPLTPEGGYGFAPRLRMQCHSLSSGADITVVARRRFLVA